MAMHPSILRLVKAAILISAVSVLLFGRVLRKRAFGEITLRASLEKDKMDFADDELSIQSAPMDKVVLSQPAPISNSSTMQASCGSERRAMEVRRMCGTSKVKAALESLAKGDVKISDKFLVDDVHKIIYCFIPKVGCTTFKALLGSRAGDQSNTSLEDTRDKLPFVHQQSFLENHGIQTLLHYSPEERAKRLQTYFKFMVVRHPFDRLLSAWRDKIEYMKHRNNVSEHLTEASKKRLLQFLHKVAGGSQKQHWGEYVSLCRPCDVLFDGVLRLETMGQDMTFILNMLSKGRSGTSPSPNHTQRYSPRRPLLAANTMSGVAPSDKLGTLTAIYRDVDFATKEQLFQRYRRDFELFGYNWNMTSDVGSCGFADSGSSSGCC